MKRLKLHIIAILLLASFIVPRILTAAEPQLSVTMGGGYAGNLYADSFGISNAYLSGSISASLYHPGKTALYCGYTLAYYEYDTNDIINSFIHSVRASIYDKRANKKLKWGLTSDAALRDYPDRSSTFNNGKIMFKGDFSYYLYADLQVRGLYGFGYSDYFDHDVLENFEHQIQLELARTFRTKTTARVDVSYGYRSFSVGNSHFDWIGTRLKISQSINPETGGTISYHRRWASENTRPLSSFYIISGVTQYWDPWDGGQLELSIKRILPRGILSSIESELWDRRFSYDEVMRRELPWIEGKSGRHDYGWSVRLTLQRQYNAATIPVQSLRLSLSAGFLSNRSNDEFYEYNDLLVNGNLKCNIF